MSAQYRPYRPEDAIEILETTSWTDNELGSIQIYEKTTEELPFNPSRRKVFLVGSAAVILAFSLGFFSGIFIPGHLYSNGNTETDIDNEEPESSYQTDSSIKDKLLEEIDVNNIRKIIREHQNIDRRPGSQSEKLFAQFVADQLISFGLDNVSITDNLFETMQPERPSIVKLMSKENTTIFTNLEEEQYEFPDMRPYLPLSRSDEKHFLTDAIIYVNKGLKDDFDKLESMGIVGNDTHEKIFVMRQSYYLAHEIVINAQERGAAAILIFPDPAVYSVNSPFPSVLRLPQDTSVAHPLSWTAYEDISNLLPSQLDSKLSFDKSDKVVTIPVIPISYLTASKILSGLSGQAVPSSWNPFEFTLHVGPGYKDKNPDNRNKLAINFFNKPKTFTTSTITATILGTFEPDRYVIVASRRDSLTRGALDSISGTAVMMEIARVYGSLLRQGWRPRRTIVFTSFGAESLNMISSGYWLNEHQTIINSRAVAFINCDLIVIGNQTVSIAASPMMYQALYNATKQVANPNIDLEPEQKTVYDSWKLSHTEGNQLRRKIFEDIKQSVEKYDKSKIKLANEAIDSPSENVQSPGSILHSYWESSTILDRPRVRKINTNSIYTRFLLFSGIPTVDMKFVGFNKNPLQDIYSDMIPILGSKNDNVDAVRMIDPNLKYHKAMAQTISETLRNLCDSLYLPFNLLDYAFLLKESYHIFVSKFQTVVKNNSRVDIGKFFSRYVWF